MFIGKTKDSYPKPDGKYTFDKLSSVFITGNATRDDAPNHIRVQKNVPREVAETWRWMCPAGVYEIPEDAPEHGNVDVIVNYTNCVQCGAITAKGGRLTTPEGGDGPLYQHDLSAAAQRGNAPPHALVRDTERTPASPHRPCSLALAAAVARVPRRQARARGRRARVAATARRSRPIARAAFAGAMPASPARAHADALRPAPAPRRRAVGAGRASPSWRRLGAVRAGRSGFVFTKRVDDAAAPAAYRAAVHFRWLDAQGHAPAHATRTTPRCEQPDPRPDLASAASRPPTPAATAPTRSPCGNDGRSTQAVRPCRAVDGVARRR